MTKSQFRHLLAGTEPHCKDLALQILEKQESSRPEYKSQQPSSPTQMKPSIPWPNSPNINFPTSAIQDLHPLQLLSDGSSANAFMFGIKGCENK